MKKHNVMNLIENLLQYPVMFIGTWLIPIFVGDILNFDNKNISILAAVSSTILLLVLYLVKSNIHFRWKNTALDKSIKGSYTHVKLYAINGRGWAEILRNSDFHATTCTVLVRKYIPSIKDKNNEERYESEKLETIAIFKQLVEEQKIGSVKIYQYDYIPDVYYLLLDDKKLCWGLNIFDQNDATGQFGNRDYRIITNAQDQELIKEYNRKFDNCVEHYQAHVLYESKIL